MKPRLRFLPKDGDATKAAITFFCPSGLPAKESLVVVSNCQQALSGRGGKEFLHQVTDAIRRFDREVALGFWGVRHEL